MTVSTRGLPSVPNSGLIWATRARSASLPSYDSGERAGGPVVRGTDDMISTRRAARARAIASAQLEYRAWSEDPQTAPIPAIAVLSSRAIHRREHDRALRRAQNGVFSTPARMAVAF